MDIAKKITLGQKIVWGGVVLVSLLAAIAIMLQLSLKQIRQEVADAERTALAVETALLLDIAQLRIEAAIPRFAEFGDPKYLEEIQDNRAKVDERRAKLKELSRNDEVKGRLADYDAKLPVIRDVTNKIISAVQAKKEAGSIRALVEERREAEEAIREELKALVDLEQVLMAASQAKLKKRQAEISTDVTVYLTAIVFFSILMIFLLYRTAVPVVRRAILQMSASTNELQATVQEQSSGASEQSSTVAEVTSTMEELAQTASRIAAAAQSMTQAVDASFKAMQLINEKVNAMAKRMLTLGEKSQSIGGITKMIDDLADQTNLLALNAAIEAARAGEAGRGFAVVAGEVRKLAERSGESTQDIRNLITEIQGETNAVIMGVEDSSKSVAKGLEQISQTVTVIKEISLATQQQKSASDQVTQAMRNIDDVVKQFATSSRQIAATVQELNALSVQLRTMVGGRGGRS